jgi:hypothetical protein
LPVVAVVVDFDFVAFVVVFEMVPLAEQDPVLDESLAAVSSPVFDVVSFGFARV